MTEKYDGGSAFPNLTPTNPQIEYCDRGMSLRDWFAGQAMMGIIAHPGNVDCEGGRHFAKTAYEMADAMLEARK
jgi:hypothetical protein